VTVAYGAGVIEWFCFVDGLPDGGGCDEEVERDLQSVRAASAKPVTAMTDGLTALTLDEITLTVYLSWRCGGD